MKWSALCMFFMLSFLALVSTSCYPLTKLPVHYGSPNLSGIFVDAETGKPVEGVSVQVAWRSLRRTGNEHNPDMMDIHSVTTVTDSNGVFTIPAWSRWVAIEWEDTGAPIVSYSKEGYKKDYTDGLSNGERFSLAVDHTIKYVRLDQSDAEIRTKIRGAWIKKIEWENAYAQFTNVIAGNGTFEYTGTIFSTNGTPEAAWQAEGTWRVKYGIFVKNATKTSDSKFDHLCLVDGKIIQINEGTSGNIFRNMVLLNEHVMRVDDDELILSSSFDGSISGLKRIK